ncbi:NAD(+)/NADH kinase [Candidatus Sumerlaeota bacterium]|nr:NAD(+)/NADH kinase [Candidatus Sumerlaeota bacterium]
MAESIASGRARRIARVLIVGKKSTALLPVLKKQGFVVVRSPEKADFVITYGGDGSLLGADREYPNLPKLAIRSSEEYVKCDEHADAEVLGRVARGKHSSTFLRRLKADAKGESLSGINDIVFHNEIFTSAVRYRVRIDEQDYSDEVVGDGLVVATPFGSSAYYRAITNSVFRVGLGLAFNNSTESVNHLVLDETASIQVEVTRGPAQLIADNNPHRIALKTGDSFSIRLGNDAAEIWEISTVFCKKCLFRASRRPAGSRHV